MADVKWIKLSVDMFDNRKIKYLRRLPDGDAIILIWIMLLTMAGRCNSGGMIFLTESIAYDSKMLANELGFEESTVQLALTALEKLGMVSTNFNGYLQVNGWEEHQNIDGMEKLREQNRLRQKKWYDSQKTLPNAEPNVIPNVSITQPNATDIEKNKKEELEKNIYISSPAGNDCETDVSLSIVDCWNQMASKNGLASVQSIQKSSTRYKNLKARIAEHGKEKIIQAIDNVNNSPFLLGREGKTPFIITFDWFVKPNNFVKVLDGNYLDRKSGINRNIDKPIGAKGQLGQAELDAIKKMLAED